MLSTEILAKHFLPGDSHSIALLHTIALSVVLISVEDNSHVILQIVFLPLLSTAFAVVFPFQ